MRYQGLAELDFNRFLKLVNDNYSSSFTSFIIELGSPGWVRYDALEWAVGSLRV